MSTQHVVLVRATCAPRANASKLMRQLNRYDVCCRPAVQALARSHPRLADLAWSFPALLFTLAMRRGSPAAQAAVRQIIVGTGLKEAANTVGLPAWLRSLPPEAFRLPLPPMPEGDAFARQIANHLPTSPRDAARWLAAVSDAFTIAGESIALWVARETASKPHEVRSLRLVYLWIWYCSADGTPANTFVEKSWSMAMTYATARKAAQRWFNRSSLWLYLGSTPMEDTWAVSGSFSGYDFVPLATANDIEAEATAMQNCLVTYGDSVAGNASSLWSVRRAGQRVATLELTRSVEDGYPVICMMKQAGNARCSADEWLAARRWLASQNLACSFSHRAKVDRDRWFALWKPYWIAHRRIPSWLPLNPTFRTLNQLFSIGPRELLGGPRRRGPQRRN